jgi:hypothetical protein
MVRTPHGAAIGGIGLVGLERATLTDNAFEHAADGAYQSVFRDN